MNNFTLAQKQALEALVEAGTQVAYAGYDPATAVDIPPPPTGFSVYYSESTATLVETIYIK